MIQVYTGDGKGKTTAALGLALRCLGAGFSVLMIQFMKKGDFSEIKALKKFNKFKLKQFGRQEFVDKNNIKEEDKKRASQAFAYAVKKITEEKFDLIILDEINVALYFNLFDINKVIDFLYQNKNDQRNYLLI